MVHEQAQPLQCRHQQLVTLQGSVQFWTASDNVGLPVVARHQKCNNVPYKKNKRGTVMIQYFAKRTVYAGWLVAITTGLCVAHADLAHAAKDTSPSLKNRVAALEVDNAELKARVDELQAFVKKLHRNSAAVIDIDTGGGSSTTFNEVEVILNFCTDEEYSLNLSFSCPDDLRDLSVTLSNGDGGQAFTFTAANDPDFSAIASLLTDANADWIAFKTKFGASAAFTSPEPVYFKDFLPSDGVDLEGYEIESITLVVDVMIISGSDPTNYTLRGRLYYEFGD
jgi:hypothetical protein